MNLGNIHVSVGADTAQFERSMQAVSNRLSEFGNRLQGIGQNLTAALTVPLGILGGAAVKAATTMDSLSRGLTAVMNDASAASEEMKNLREVAKLPGLGLEEAARGSINLQAVGYSADQARKILTNFGNALATVGKGKADLDGVILALSQIQSKGKVSVEEINQLAERVPQIRKIMQTAFGTADTEVLQKMGLSSTEFVNRITEEFGKLPKVAGGMQNTFENLSDTVKNSLATLGKSIFETFNIGEKLDNFSKFVERVTESFQALSPETQKIILSVAGIAAAIGPALIAFAGISKAAAIVGTALAGLSAPFLAIAAVVASVAYLIISNWDKIQAYFQGEGRQMIEDFGRVWQGLQDVVSGVMTYVSAFVKQITDYIADIWSKHGELIMQVIKNAWRFITDTVGTALSQIGLLFSTFGNLLSGNWTAAWDNIKDIAYNAVNYIIRQVNALFDLIGLTKYKLDELKSESAKPIPKLLNSRELQNDSYNQVKPPPIAPPKIDPPKIAPPSSRRAPASSTPRKTVADEVNDITTNLNRALEAINRKRGALDNLLFPKKEEIEARINVLSSALERYFNKGLTSSSPQVQQAVSRLQDYTAQVSEFGSVTKIAADNLGNRLSEIATVSVPKIVEGISEIAPPMAEWTQSALDLDNAFKSLANDTLANVAGLLGDSLSEMLVMGKSLNTVFQDIASGLKDILKDIVATLIKAAALKAIGAAFGLPVGAQSFGSIFGGLIGGGNAFKLATPNMQSQGLVSVKPSVSIGMGELVFAIEEYKRST